MYKILNEIKELLENNLPDKFKKIYLGKIEQTFQKYVPVAMVYPLSLTTNEGHTTCTDRVNYSIRIRVLTDCHGEASDIENIDNELKAQKKLWELVDNRDSENAYTDDCILGVLRANLRGDYFFFNSIFNINFDNIKETNTTFLRCDIDFNILSKFVKR